jgi:hypothetical protein
MRTSISTHFSTHYFVLFQEKSNQKNIRYPRIRVLPFKQILIKNGGQIISGCLKMIFKKQNS